jgi:predicted NBD/HSP70 family sugar kinase
MSKKLAIDIGASFTKIGYSHDGYNVSDIVLKETAFFCKEPVEFYENICNLVSNKWQDNIKNIFEINIALHGVVSDRILVKSTRLKEFIGFDFNKIFKNIKWNIYNDACAAAIGGFIKYKGLIKYPTLVLTLGTGVGLAIIKNKSTVESLDSLSSRKARRRAKSGSTSSTPAATWARPTR